MAEKLMQELQEANNNLCDRFGNDKIKELVEECFTEDCRTMSPGMDVVIGREGAVNIFTSLRKAGGHKVKSTTLEIIPGGDDILTDRGCFTYYTKSGEVLKEGIYVALRKKINGHWLFHFDLYNFKKD